jgi:hypothetical protein
VLLQRSPLDGLLTLAPTPTLRGLTFKQKQAIAGRMRFRTWLAGRRAGKSYAAAVWLLGGKAGQVSAYCARTLKSAKSIMLGVFAELNAKYNLGLEIRASTGTITEPSGHVIQLYGLRDTTQADLLRGQKFRRVVIDEMGAFHDDLLKYSIESVLQPTLLDLRGDMVVMGTPGPIPKGYAYDMTGNPGLSQPVQGRWPTYHWTYEDNPHMPRELVLEEALKVNGWLPSSPTFRREYGAIWCEDADALIYRYKGERAGQYGGNGWAPIPGPGMTIMGLDFGVVDSVAWVVGRQPYDARPHIFALEAVAKDNIDLPEIAAITKNLREKWSVNRILADEGALGKALANNLRNQYHIPIEPARKQDKRGRIVACRGRLAAGTYHLYEEWLSLCWNDPVLRDDHHERQADDLSDANLYMTDAEEFIAYEMPETRHEDVTLETALRQRAMQKALRGNGLGILD